jgi:pyruvate/2-oxoglutarate dehydrogenase complex dihydrolipoamide acyltransferase (E2) component
MTNEPTPPKDRLETVPLGLRWIDDAFHVAPSAGGVVLRLVDMTRARAAIRTMRDAKLPVTLAHLIVRACAIVLARNPQWHKLACNYRRLTPASVDIGLSMAGQTTYAPVVVLPAVDRQPLAKLVPTIIQAIDAAAEKEIVDLRNMRNLMWMVPFGFFRRLILRMLNSSLWFRRRLVGTFQVSLMTKADMCAPLLFYTGAMLTASAVRDRVVAVDGQPAVRPTMWITLGADHNAMDGVQAEDLLEAIKNMLEGEELLQEAREAREARRALPAGTVAQDAAVEQA